MIEMRLDHNVTLHFITTRGQCLQTLTSNLLFYNVSHRCTNPPHTVNRLKECYRCLAAVNEEMEKQRAQNQLLEESSEW